MNAPEGNFPANLRKTPSSFFLFIFNSAYPFHYTEEIIRRLCELFPPFFRKSGINIMLFLLLFHERFS